MSAGDGKVEADGATARPLDGGGRGRGARRSRGGEGESWYVMLFWFATALCHGARNSEKLKKNNTIHYVGRGTITMYCLSLFLF